MTTENTPPPVTKNASHGSGISLRALLLYALLPSLMVLGGLVYMVTSGQSDVRQECQRMLLASLPKLTEQQRSAITLERLRLRGNTVYNTLDPLARRKARIEAQALISDDALAQIPDSQPVLEQAHEELQRMALARGAQSSLREQMYETVARIESVHTQLLNAFIVLPKAQALAQMTNFSASFMELLNVNDIRNMSTGEENVVIIINKISSLEAQARGGGLPEGVVTNYRILEQQSYLFLQLYKDYFSAEKATTDSQQEFDKALHNLSDLITANATLELANRLQNIISLAMWLERITWQGLMLLCATVIMFLFLIRNFVCLPVLWLGKTIDAIHDGSDSPPEPRIIVSELHRFAKALLQLKFYGMQLRGHALPLESAPQFAAGLSIKDGLTGLFNRRYFDVILHNMWAEAVREGGSVALLLMDIDQFDKYNRNLGSPKGDECLKLLAHTFKNKVLRPADKVCRYGGEEFALLIPCLNAEGPLRVAARLHAGVRQMALEHPDSMVSERVTLSIGVVVHTPREGDAAPMLVTWAERALRAAKNGGRNRTYVCQLHCNADGSCCETLEEVAHDNDTIA